MGQVMLVLGHNVAAGDMLKTDSTNMTMHEAVVAPGHVMALGR